MGAEVGKDAPQKTDPSAVPPPAARAFAGAASLLKRGGALILSEFAGAAAQLRHGALLVNPHDIEGMADALDVAFRMEQPERLRRMRGMQEILRKQDIFWWVDCYLKAALGSVPEDFRAPKEKEEFVTLGGDDSWVEV